MDADLQERVIVAEVEGRPWKQLAYMIYVAQVLYVCLDTAMGSQVQEDWENAAATVQFIFAVLLTFYQSVRLWFLLNPIRCQCRLWKKRQSPEEPHAEENITEGLLEPTLLLLLTAFMQAAIAALSLVTFATRDSIDQQLIWSMYGLTVSWSLLFPMTYDAVEAAYAKRQQSSNQRQRLQQHQLDSPNRQSTAPSSPQSRQDARKRTWSGPVKDAISILTKHFTQTPLRYAVVIACAAAYAALGAYEGVLIDELIATVYEVINSTDPPAAGNAQVLSRAIAVAYLMIMIWFVAHFVHFLFDLVSSDMFARLEIWMLETIFRVAVKDHVVVSGNGLDHSHHRQILPPRPLSPASRSMSTPDSALQYVHDWYTEGTSTIVKLYAALLQGLIKNVLIALANFIVLVYLDWTVGVLSLAFGTMIAITGPTHMTADATAELPQHITKCLDLLQEYLEHMEQEEQRAEQQEDRPNVHDYSQNPSTNDTNGDANNANANRSFNVVERHRKEVLTPLQDTLFRESLFAESVDTFLLFVSSFLAIVSIILMAWKVFDQKLALSRLLAIYYIFQQLLTACCKLPGILSRVVVHRTPFVQDMNAVLFPNSEEEIVFGHRRMISEHTQQFLDDTLGNDNEHDRDDSPEPNDDHIRRYVSAGPDIHRRR